MIRAVLDTNTLASGALSSTGVLAEIINAWYTRTFELVASPFILEELTRTLDKPYFRDRLDGKARADFLARVKHHATTTIRVHIAGVASHPEDDLILATAISGRVDYLVTGDHALQKLGTYQDISILPPTLFLAVLKQARAEERE